MNRKELEQLWLQQRELGLSPEEARQLADELARNGLERQQALRDVETEQELVCLARCSRTEEAFSDAVLARWQSESRTTPPPPADEPLYYAVENEDELPDTPWVIDEGKPAGTRWRWALAAGLLLCLSSLYFWATAGSTERHKDVAANENVRPQQPAAGKPAAPPEAEPRAQDKPGPQGPLPGLAPVAPQQPALPQEPPRRFQQVDPNGKPPEKSIARLTKAEACRWKGGEPEEWFGKQDVLHLLSGKATITFHDGAVVELEGPVLFELNSIHEGVLRHGQATVTVPAKAAEFRVQTPVGTVQNNNTKYTLTTAEDGATTIKVHEGVAALQETGPDGKPGNLTQIKPDKDEHFAMKPQPGLMPGMRRARAQVNINGRVLEMQGIKEAEEMQRRMMERIARMQQGQGIEGLEEFRKLQKELLEDLARMQRVPGKPKVPEMLRREPMGLMPMLPGKPGMGAGNFHGVLEIDGKRVEFDDPVEFAKAIRKQARDRLQQP